MSQLKSTSATQPSRVKQTARRGRTPAARRTRRPGRYGPLLARYNSRRLGARDILFLFLPGVAAILAPFGYGLWRADYAYARYGPVAAEHWSRPWYFLAIVAAGIFLLLGLYRLQRSLTSVKVYRNGLTIRTGIGRARNFEWDDFQGITSSAIQEYFFGLPIRNTFRTRLILLTGKSIKLPERLQNLPELISRIKAHLYPRLFPKLLAEFRSGAWMAFGPVAIQSRGLRLDKREISWRQVKQIDVRAGMLMIEFNDRPPQKLPVDRIPNLELVLQLINQGIP